MQQLKTCTKCGIEKPATLQFFYKNAGGKFGVTPRCKPCVNADNAQAHAKRLAENPEHVRALASHQGWLRHYHTNLVQSRERARESAAKARECPERKVRIQSRKRAGGAGLSPEEIRAIRDRQGNACAICLAPGPTDLDHCHDSGKVRGLLCKHCNRGLGAFRDSLKLLERAAMFLKITETEK